MLRTTKIFQFHLLKFPGPEGEITRVDLVTKRLPDLSDAERELFAGNFQNVPELYENGLGRFGTQVGQRRIVFRGADVRFEHQVKCTGFGEVLASADRALWLAILNRQLVGTQTRLAASAIHHRIAESLFVPAGRPDLPVHQNGPVEPDHVVPFPDHSSPPKIFEVTFKFDPERAVIPATVQATINFTCLEDEPPPFAKADDLFHSFDFRF